MKKEKLFCKWFNDSKGYGYMVKELSSNPETPKQDEYFIHYKAIDIPGFQTIKEGQAYDCETEYSLKGYTVTKCKVG